MVACLLLGKATVCVLIFEMILESTMHVRASLNNCGTEILIGLTDNQVVILAGSYLSSAITVTHHVPTHALNWPQCAVCVLLDDNHGRGSVDDILNTMHGTSAGGE